MKINKRYMSSDNQSFLFFLSIFSLALVGSCSAGLVAVLKMGFFTGFGVFFFSAPLFGILGAVLSGFYIQFFTRSGL